MFYVPWCVCVCCECLSGVLGVFGVFDIFWFLVPSVWHIMPYGQNQTVLDCCVDLGGHACPRFGEISLDAPDLGLDLPQLKFPAIVIAELDFGLWTFSFPSLPP